MSAAKMGDLNPAKQPGVGAKISASHIASGRFYGPNHPNFKGEWITRPAKGKPRAWRWITPEEMIEFETTQHYVQRARYVWNRAHPDDPLKPGEFIHHLNDDALDDRAENFEKLSSSEHTRLHMKGKPWSPERRARGWTAKRRATFEATGR